MSLLGWYFVGYGVFLIYVLVACYFKYKQITWGDLMTNIILSCLFPLLILEAIVTSVADIWDKPIIKKKVKA